MSCFVCGQPQTYTYCLHCDQTFCRPCMIEHKAKGYPEEQEIDHR